MRSRNPSEIIIPDTLVQAVREQRSCFADVVRLIARRPEHLESVTEEHIQHMTIVRDALLARIAEERQLDEQQLSHELARHDEVVTQSIPEVQSAYFVRNNQV